MDVAELIRDARGRRGWSQAQLAAATGTTRGAIGDYETGRKSPTVATLNRVLAAAGLQIRAELEPLRADLLARVEAARGEAEPLDAAGLAKVGEVLDGAPVAWGLDGETALRALGYGFASDRVHVAICFDAPAREWFFRARVRGTGGAPVSWFDADLRAAQEYLGGMAFGPFGMVAVRLVREAPRTVRVEVAPGLVVPVLTVEEVGRGRPHLGEVLERLGVLDARPVSRATPGGGGTPRSAAGSRG
jgi:transcriptional regulator with XRE-family HTH domain